MTESEFVSVQKMHGISGVDLNSLQIIKTRDRERRVCDVSQLTARL
jgi:predicted MarR family transcription regulator